MPKQNVSRTAVGPAVCRLIEQYQSEDKRLFSDPVVGRLLGGVYAWLMSISAMRRLTFNLSERTAKGVFGAQLCRTRYDDDVVRSGVSDGAKQLVILGAGYDTRPYRLPGLEGVRVFEIDLPAIQADKKAKLQRFLVHLLENVTYLPVDFETQTLESAFASTVFDPTLLTVFIWEGVTQYLTADAVQQTLAFVGKSAPGSRLSFTYVPKSVIERRSGIPGAEAMMDRVAVNAPWLFGLEPSEIAAFLQPFHLALVEDVGGAEYQERYLRPLQRELAVFAGERIAQAKVVAA